MTDARTQLVGLIGWPVEHSLSPAMHNAAFEALGLNWHYVPLPVAPGRVEAALRGLEALGFRGANVTVPHKLAVVPLLDGVAGDARALGAVNTLDVRRGEDGGAITTGHNTDARGFVGALRAGGFEPAGGGRAVVVGAGGAARSVVYGLLAGGMNEVAVLNRTPERAHALVADLAGHVPDGVLLRGVRLTVETLVESARGADLLVNATTLGMWPRVEGSIWPEAVSLPAHLTVFDLVYNPLETRFLGQARRAGARAIDGLGMLVGQGAIAFSLWTGAGPLSDIMALMRAACEAAQEHRL
jgi:shikimate dehydrogenase